MMRAKALLCGALALAAAGCAAQEKPGELIGVYSIVGELTENTCGNAALPAPDPLEFEVELRRVSEAAGLWLLGMPPGSPGSLDSDGEFAFTSESTFSTSAPSDNASTELLEMDPLALANLDTFETFEQADQPQSCTLRISEEVRGTIVRDGRVSAPSAKGPAPAGDEDDPDLLGENVISVRAAGGDCSIVMLANGGPFDDLPCRAHYDIVGDVLDDESN